MKPFFNMIALEGDTSGKTAKAETEIWVFARIGDPARLAEGQDREDHDQLEARFETGIPARVRKVTKGANVKYLFTMKTPIKVDGVSNIDANNEDTVEVNESFFHAYRLAANRRLVKTRYTFNSTNVTLTYKDGSEDRSIVIPNVKYEVDVYIKENGKIADWCKIDVEVDTILEYINNNHKELKDLKLNIKVSHLPFAPNSAILGTDATDEQRLRIDEIWKELTQPLNVDNVEGKA